MNPREKKRYLVVYKGDKCADCGNSFPDVCYDFDHRDIEQKSFEIGRGIGRNMPLSELIVEADKCDLVCANCHRIRTANNPKIRERLRIASTGNHHGLGKKRTLETRAKMSAAKVGNKYPLGCKRSPETRAKLSIVRIGRGHPVSAETRAKISASSRGKKKPRVRNDAQMRLTGAAW